MEIFADSLRNIIFASLGITVVLCVSLYFFKPVEGILVYDPVGTKLIHFFAYASLTFVALGIMCIFWTKIRIPVGIALGFYVLLFLCSLPFVSVW